MRRRDVWSEKNAVYALINLSLALNFSGLRSVFACSDWRKLTPLHLGKSSSSRKNSLQDIPVAEACDEPSSGDRVFPSSSISHAGLELFSPGCLSPFASPAINLTSSPSLRHQRIYLPFLWSIYQITLISPGNGAFLACAICFDTTLLLFLFARVFSVDDTTNDR